MVEYSFKNEDGLMLIHNQISYQITDFPCEFYGYCQSEHGMIVVYEESDGSLVKVEIKHQMLQKETLLLCQSFRRQNRKIYIELFENELYVFFSANYKGNPVILLYTKRHSVCVFDCCDGNSFFSLSRRNGDILLFYRRKGQWGYRVATNSSESRFVVVSEKHAIKAFEWNRQLFLLTFEKHYFLHHLDQNICYSLPLVYHRKPFIYCQENAVYIRYRFYHRHLIYKIENNEILFWKEEEY